MAQGVGRVKTPVLQKKKKKKSLNSSAGGAVSCLLDIV
jgi:hypothetical protein